MKKKAKRIKRNPRSEAAMREALDIWRDAGDVYFKCGAFNGEMTVRALDFTGEVLAIFDLRDCYRKRAPLKGVAKELKKVMTKRRR